MRFALFFCDSALVCLCGIWAVLGFEFFQWLIYISAMALPLQLPLALTLLSSGLFFGFAPNFVGCLLLERHSVDSDESLRWLVCTALEFCTACVEAVCSFFSLCLILAGIAGNWFLQWRWLEPGPLCPFRVGHENCFYGSWKQFWSLVCAQRTIVFAGVAIPPMALFCENCLEKSSSGFLSKIFCAGAARKAKPLDTYKSPPLML